MNEAQIGAAILAAAGATEEKVIEGLTRRIQRLEMAVAMTYVGVMSGSGGMSDEEVSEALKPIREARDDLIKYASVGIAATFALLGEARKPTSVDPAEIIAAFGPEHRN